MGWVGVQSLIILEENFLCKLGHFRAMDVEITNESEAVFLVVCDPSMNKL